MQMIGTMRLARTVNNLFQGTEQVASCKVNVIPGDDFTDDPLLRGRNFSCLDTPLTRLGSPNFTKRPINAPRIGGVFCSTTSTIRRLTRSAAQRRCCSMRRLCCRVLIALRHWPREVALTA